MDRLAIGIVQRPHGIKGHVRVRSLSGETEHFFGLEKVTLRKGGREVDFTIEAVKVAGKDLLIKFSGLDSPEDAKKFASWEILVPRELACPLKEGEYYVADLCDCALILDGKPIGRIRSVVEGVTNDMLEVEREGAASFFVPFVKEHVGDVDFGKKTVELKSGWLVP